MQTRAVKRVRPVRKTKPYKHLNLEGVSCNILEDNPVPSYKNKYDMTPHFLVDNDDEFICAAVFTEKAMNDYIANKTDSDNFKNGKLRRIDLNMTPYFFVYESDDLPLEEQLKMVDKVLDSPFGGVITSVTFSGSKSIHVLVKIPERWRLDVKKDFKFYWDNVAEYLYHDDKKYLDKACASISRLTRKPNGIRENGVKQTCYYYNKDACLLDSQFAWTVPGHNKKLAKQEAEMLERERERLLRKDALKEEDEYEKLERMHKKGASGAFEVAYNAIHDICPAGENYVAALRSLKSRGFSVDMQRVMLENVSSAHPSNISRSRVEYLLRD